MWAQVGCGVDGIDARVGARRRQIDAADEGMCVRTAHECGVPQAGKTDVVDETASAGQKVAIFEPCDVFPERTSVQAFCPASPLRRFAASSAEITMFW